MASERINNVLWLVNAVPWIPSPVLVSWTSVRRLIKFVMYSQQPGLGALHFKYLSFQSSVVRDILPALCH